MSKNVIVGSLVFLLLVGGVTWALLRDRESPEMTEIKQLQKELFSEDGRKPMTAQQKAEAIKRLKEEAKGLSKEEQVRLGKEYRKQAMKQEVEYIDGFLALKTKKERDAFLDEALDREQAYAKKSVPKDQSKAKERGKAKDDAKKVWAQLNTQERRDSLRGYSDSASADQRARFEAYSHALEARRKERGLRPRW